MGINEELFKPERLKITYSTTKSCLQPRVRQDEAEKAKPPEGSVQDQHPMPAFAMLIVAARHPQTDHKATRPEALSSLKQAREGDVNICRSHVGFPGQRVIYDVAVRDHSKEASY